MHGLFQSLRDLYRKPHGFVRRERALKGFSVNLLHYQIVWTDIVELADVWMAQCGDGTGFAAESLPVLALQACDGNRAVNAGVECLPDLAHAASAEGGE
ncbi:MAG: hypothetical protein DMG15_27165 [Acidobacteria bacterium]|nr:MAG: hypothetical protein DMG16_29055 [Acidobacteriota bacterium]PYS08398.1 MAG: hypothetical protein DMG15_27165 [Acidobacteriota bacterium]